jgi:uncharacterized membrane protein
VEGKMRVKKVLIICAIVLLLTVVLEIAFVRHKIYYWWHELIGFDILFGFFGCAAIIIISRFLGSAFIQRKENYYDGGEDNDV